MRKLKKNDFLNDNIVTSMLEKFRKLEERLFSIENEQSESNITFCNPSTVEKSCEECDYITEKEDDLEVHVQNDHGNSPNKISNIETIETEGEEIYKCSVCEFKTTHNPGLKSHMTKMHVINVVKPLKQERN